MNIKGRGLFAGGILAAALFIGTAGLAVARNPTATPSPAWDGAGMMGGQGADGVMTPDLFAQMGAIHDQTVASGGTGFAQMDAMHDQHHPNR